MKFTKMQGAGNDYIYVNCFTEAVPDPESTAIRVSDRHFGIGADGLVLIRPSETADFFMDIYNADGSRAKMCGNASRCVAKYVYDNKMTDKTEIALETRSGIKHIRVQTENGKVVSARVNMGAPILTPHEIPTRFDGDTVIRRKLTVGDTDYAVTCVSMGNPHCVVYMPEIWGLDLAALGAGFERHEMFPDRVNTEFIRVADETHLEMRVWERGSGETLACGTGACAAAVAAILGGDSPRDTEIAVRLRGGTLWINWAADGDVYMTGPAETVCTGDFPL